METAADLFVACLAEAGIDTVYALPGEETNALMTALRAAEFDVVICRHEQSAAFMASVHGRLTGRTAACLATLGPGATNLMTGVADAMLDRAPLLAITGQAPVGRLPQGADGHQVLDLSRLFEPVTKRSQTIFQATDIPGAVAEAARLAQAPKPGAVHLSLPEDIAGAPAPDLAPVRAAARPTAHASPLALDQVEKLMAAAERPIVLAGAGTLRNNASAALCAFLDRTGYPMATTFMAKGILHADDPRNLGAFGLPGTDHVDRAVAAADLIVTVGYDPVEYPLHKLTDGRPIPVAALTETDIPDNLGWPLAAVAEGDLSHALCTLCAVAEPAPVWTQAAEARDALRADLAEARADMTQCPPAAGPLVAALNAASTAQDVVFSGVGTHKLAIARDFQPHWPGQAVIANGLAGMGLALPGAIAAARLRQEGRVIAVCGDGDVMMNVQELESATRLDLAVTLVVWIDGGFGLIEDKQEAETGARPDLSFAPVDWAALARAFGWHHTGCHTAQDLQRALETRAARREIVTVPVRYDGTLA